MGCTVSTMAHEMAGASIAPQGQAGTAKAAPGTGLCSSQQSCSFMQHFATSNQTHFISVDFR